MAMSESASDDRDTSASSDGSPLYLSGVCLVASIGGLLFGFDTAVISGTVEFVESKFLWSKLEVGWFVSSALAGWILGAAVAGTLSDRFGRKPILIVSEIPASVFAGTRLPGGTIPAGIAGP
jgi:MFS transporter, SP family, arabinose:H+ symporter